MDVRYSYIPPHEAEGPDDFSNPPLHSWLVACHEHPGKPGGCIYTTMTVDGTQIDTSNIEPLLNLIEMQLGIMQIELTDLGCDHPFPDETAFMVGVLT